MSSKPFPAVSAVLAVISALLLSLVVAVGLLMWTSYANAIERARISASASAQVVATHVKWLMAASLQALEAADRLAGSDIAAMSADGRAGIAPQIEHLPDGVTISFFGLDNTLLYSSASPAIEESAPGRVEAAAIDPGASWSIAAPRTEQEVPARDIVIARRIERDGQPAGTAVLRVPVENLNEVWQSLNLGPGSTVGMIRTDGWLIARTPPATAPLDLSTYLLFTDYLKKSPIGTYDAISPVDGTHRIVAYRNVPGLPIVVQASVARDVALAPVMEQVKRMSIAFVPLAAIVAILATWLVRLLRRDERLRSSLAVAVDRNNILMREIHHRIKNNLQAVASLIQLQPMTADTKAQMRARIAAMSALHEQAYKFDQYSDIDLKEYLGRLVDLIRQTSPPHIDVVADLKPAIIDRDLAQPIGLIANEVISNSLKHAFNDRSTGRIEVILTVPGPGQAELEIRDDGVGFEGSVAGNGMGSRLIRAFAQQVGNDFAYEQDNGTRFRIRFPVRDLAKGKA